MLDEYSTNFITNYFLFALSQRLYIRAVTFLDQILYATFKYSRTVAGTHVSQVCQK